MFFVFESRVHQQTQDLNVILGYNRLSLDGKRVMIQFTRLWRKVYDSCLLGFKGRPASPFPVERFIDNCFNSFPVTLRGWPGHPGSKIIHKSDCTSLAVDLSLHEVCVEK
jgi:hypothetical protein